MALAARVGPLGRSTRHATARTPCLAIAAAAPRTPLRQGPTHRRRLAPRRRPGPGLQAYYYFLGALGRKTHFVASLLLRRVTVVVAPGDRILLGLDDTPTKRYGPHVEGAGIHHNPSPGPADQKFLYGHIWVTIAWLACHPRWGAIGLPLRALLMSAPRTSAG